MSDQTPTLPIKVNSDIQSSYVLLNERDVVYTNFETSRLLTRTGTTTGADTLATSVCALTANLTSALSGAYRSTRMLLHKNHFENNTTGLTVGIGVFSLRKRFFDSQIEPGSLTATCSGRDAGDYIDSGSGELIDARGSTAVGSFINSDGMFVVTSSQSAMVLSITSVKYRACVLNTELSVYCKADPDELNYTLNPTAFNTTANGDWMTDPFTGSTSAAEYFPDLVSSGIKFSPRLSSVGLYDDYNNLLAIAKFSHPIRKPTDTPITTRVRIDI
jgi:hypothetical protein